MTKKSHTRYGLSLLALAIVATSSMGCRSTGLTMPKMPKMSLFSWNRKPDPATLAGSAQPAGLPESPAAKYDPKAIASTTGKSSSSTAGSAYGYGATGSSLGATPGMNAQAGMAAAANGYQTGPYGLAPKTGTTTATNVASTATVGSLPSGSLPSPYGGTYTGASPSLHTNPSTTSTAKADVPLPSSVTAALNRGTSGPTTTNNSSGLPAIPSATAGSTMPSTPAFPAGYANSSSGQIPASTSAYQMMPSPPTYPVTNPYTPNIPVTTGGNLGTTPGFSVGTSSSTMPTTTAVGLPAVPNQTKPATASSSTASSAYQGATTLGTVYSPGSTGRTTSYDFSGGQGATPASSTSNIPGPTAPNSTTQPLLR